MNILIYARPNSYELLHKLAKEIDKDANIVTVCDFKGCGDIWLGEYLYKNNKLNLFCEDIHENIRLRCRYLRSIKKKYAYDIIDKYSYGVSKVFDEKVPDILLGQLPDNYCMDIIQRVAINRGTVLLNFVGEFIEGYCRMTLRGELIYTREVTREEAEKVLKMLLNKDYVPNYARNLGCTLREHKIQFIRRKFIENIYYPIIKNLKHDVYNYHYNSIYYKGVHLKDVVSKKIDSLFTNLESTIIKDNCIYVPLHCYPEATVDYYGDNPKYALYEDFMLDLVEKTDDSIQLLIKEHPAMYGSRNSSFYKKMLKNKNVVLVNPYIDSNYILSKCNYVLIYSGSVGIEATIRNKVVFTLIDNYYSGLSPNIIKIDKISSDIFKHKYKEYDNVEFMQGVLRGLMDVKLGSQSNMIESDVRGLAFYMRKYYKSRPVQLLPGESN